MKFNSYIRNTWIRKGSINNYPYARIIATDTFPDSYLDMGLLLLITEDYQDGGSGLAHIQFRTNNVATNTYSDVVIQWIFRQGIAEDRLSVAINYTPGASYFDVFYKTIRNYGGCTIRCLFGNRAGVTSTERIQLTKVYEYSEGESSDIGPVNCYKSINGTEAGAAAFELHGGTQYGAIITARDSGIVDSARKDYLSQEISSTYLKNIEASGTTLTLTKGDGTTSTIETQDTRYRMATQSSEGLMSPGDKTTVDKVSVLNLDLLGKITSNNLSMVDTVSKRISLTYDHEAYDTTTVTLRASGNSSPEDFIGIQAVYFDSTLTRFEEMQGMSMSGKNYSRNYIQGRMITPTSIEISGDKSQSSTTQYGNTSYKYSRGTSITCTFDLTEIIENLKDRVLDAQMGAMLVVTASFRNKLVDSWEDSMNF